MSNLAWIKSLYHHTPMTPRPLLRKLGILISVLLGLYFYVTKGVWIPLVLSLSLAAVLSHSKLSKVFIEYLGSGIFIVFHTFTLICLIGIYYLLLTPLSILKKWMQTNDDFFLDPSASTIRVLDRNHKPQFERQF